MKGENQSGTKVTVPHLAETLVSATVGKWLKQPGDYIREYDVICELITDKVNVEMPSPVEGTLVEILVPENAEAAVGEPLCIIREPQRETAATGQGTDNPAQVAENGASGHPSGVPDMRKRYSPAVLKLAGEHGIDLNSVEGTGLGGRITRKDILAVIEKTAAQPSAAPSSGTWTAARAAGSPFGGSGAAGAPQQAPVQAQQQESRQAPMQTQDQAPQQAQQTQQTAVQAQPLSVPNVPVRSTGLHLSSEPAIPQIEVDGDGRGEYLIDVSPIRNTIAARMRQSVTEIPHAWTMIEADVTNLVLLRNKVKDEFYRREGINLTYLAFVIKAIVSAIKDFPIMNSVWAVDKIIVKRDINISLAVGTEDAVVTPVIKRADEKNIAGLAREIDELTKKARSGKLSLSDMQGGTFTVNNTGSFGSILSYPIINYPQAAIITFESIVKKPVVIQDMIAVRSMVNLCLSLDHRILDGVICGRFLQRVKDNLESYNMDTSIY